MLSGRNFGNFRVRRMMKKHKRGRLKDVEVSKLFEWKKFWKFLDSMRIESFSMLNVEKNLKNSPGYAKLSPIFDVLKISKIRLCR